MGCAMQTVWWQRRHSIPARVKWVHREGISEARASTVGEDERAPGVFLEHGAGAAEDGVEPRPAAKETAVLNKRGAGGSGSRSGARQCESALMVYHAACLIRVWEGA